MNSVTFVKRTHTCGELRPEHQGANVTLNGWVQRVRNLGGLIFVDIRDRWGITQVVFDPKKKELFETAECLRGEFVISVTGRVRLRPDGTQNLNIDTGLVEIETESLQVLNPSKTPPFVISNDQNIDESLRLKYRYLDVRRPRIFNYFKLRHKFGKAVRDFLDSRDFLEMETPMLVRSTPEGARDYLVPSRVHKGKFYALPQSPQLFKQILMIGGMERYFQIARCFRDEDQRADRQPEFTQIDIEMSFVKREDVLSLTEDMLSYCFAEVLGKKLKTPFPRLSYRDAMDRYGSDKPDTRFGMEIVDVTQLVGGTTFQVFENVIKSGGTVRGILLPGCAGYSRKQTDELSDFVKQFGQKGLLTAALKPGQFKSPLAKHLSDEQKEKLIGAFGAKEGDIIAMLAGPAQTILPVLGRLRSMMGHRLGKVDTTRDDFLWVVDFPMYSFNEEENRLEPEHHAFTSPHEEDVSMIKTDPLKVRANCYDLVFNGFEAASGSIRIHDRQLQELILEGIGMSREEAAARFGFLLQAFEYGAPPHGGVALGYDRIIAEICREESIREVIIFPKNTNGICLLTGAPVEVDRDQLDLLSLEVCREKKKPAVTGG